MVFIAVDGDNAVEDVASGVAVYAELIGVDDQPHILACGAFTGDFVHSPGAIGKVEIIAFQTQ